MQDGRKAVVCAILKCKLLIRRTEEEMGQWFSGTVMGPLHSLMTAPKSHFQRGMAAELWVMRTCLHSWSAPWRSKPSWVQCHNTEPHKSASSCANMLSYFPSPEKRGLGGDKGRDVKTRKYFSWTPFSLHIPVYRKVDANLNQPQDFWEAASDTLSVSKLRYEWN